MSPSLERPDPPFRQIADALRTDIRSGALSPGERVSSVRSLVREYGVAMATAQRALGVLRDEGYIVPQAGTGNVVTSSEGWGTAASDTVWRSKQTGRVYPEGEYARIVDATTATASATAAGALGLDDEAPAIRRVRVRYSADNNPISTSTSWFDGKLADVAPKLLSTERIIEGTFAYLAGVTGRRASAWEDQYEPAAADGGIAELLDLAPGTLVTRGENWVYDERGETLEYGESITTGRITYRGQLSD